PSFGLARPDERGLAVPVPLPQVRPGIEGVAALVPAGRSPHLEVEVARRRVARLADAADHLAGGDVVAHVEGRRLAQVRVEEVAAGAGAVDDDVVAGGRLVLAVLDPAAASGEDRRAAGGED